VRVSNELGARNPKSAAFSVVVVTVISFIISVITALIVLALRDVISYAFTEGEAVAAAVSDLCPLLALTLILNGVQPVLSGIYILHNYHRLKLVFKYELYLRLISFDIRVARRHIECGIEWVVALWPSLGIGNL
jgi:hypothetical protein